MATNTIRLHRVIRAKPERVYRAFLDADAMAKWLPPNGFTGKVHHLDAKVGGTYKMSFTNFTTGYSHSFGGEYLELVPNERIRHTDKFDDPNLPGEMQTTVSLKQMFCGTELNIVQEGIPEAIPPEACYLGWQESLTLLARNEADLVVMGRAPANLDCEATPFATNPLAIVAAPDHALVRRKHLPFSALADYSFVVREEGSGTHAAMERLFAQHQTPLRVVMEMPCNESIEQAVMAGMGLSFLSMRTVRHELASGHLALLDIEGMPLMGNGYITHLSQKKLSPAATSFKAFLIEQGGPLINSWA